MPKMKKHSGAKKRFRKTATGEIKAQHNYYNHLLNKKSSERKHRLRKPFYLNATDKGRISRLI